MPKEAMKLALEALETISVDVKTTSNAYEAQRQAITALREALAKPDFWEGYVPEPVKPSPVPWSQALEDVWAEQPAQQALDKKAENARELGLDYEIKRLEHNEEVLMNALFKACGDDAQVVMDTIESQGELK